MLALSNPAAGASCSTPAIRLWQTWKADVVSHALAAHGLDPEVRPTLTSPAQSRQRATLTGKRRTKNGAMVGFHGRASDTMIEVPDCQLIDPEIKEGFDTLRRAWQ